MRYSETVNSANRPYLEVTWSQTAKTVYFLKNHLGSIRATVDETGTVVGYDDYDPWGKVFAGRSLATPWSAGQGTTMNKFTRIPIKAETSCFQIGMKSSGISRINVMDITYNTLGAMDYDADVGRWWSVDSLVENTLEIRRIITFLEILLGRLTLQD